VASKHTPVTVEARYGDDAVVPLAVVQEGRRQKVVVVNRQWDHGWQRFFDIRLDSGRYMILCLERRSRQWYISGSWGDARAV
jgi:hypothetical protein